MSNLKVGNWRQIGPIVIAPIIAILIIILIPLDNEFNIVSVGDFGCGGDTGNTVKNIESKRPDLVLALGDLSYEKSPPGVGHICPTTDDWISTVEPIEKKLKIVIGNHDLPIPGGPDLLKTYEDRYGLCSSGKCQTYYPIDINHIHFLVMDSESAFGTDSAQYKFVQSDLEKASSDRNTDWIIVALHTPLYASLPGGLESVLAGGIPVPPLPQPGDYMKITKELIDTYHPLFDEYGVDLVLQGHLHNYQRTYPLMFNGAGNLPIRMSEDKNIYYNPGGEIFLTIGTGGIGFTDISPTTDHWIATVSGKPGPTDDYYVVKGDNTKYGFLELKPTKYSFRDWHYVTLEGTFYGNDVLNKGSIITDQFSITKPVFYPSFYGYP